MKAAELQSTLEESLPRAFPGCTVSYKENDGVPVSHFGTLNVQLSVAKTASFILGKIKTVALKGLELTQHSGNDSGLERVLYFVGTGNDAPRITISGKIEDNKVSIFEILIIKSPAEIEENEQALNSPKILTAAES